MTTERLYAIDEGQGADVIVAGAYGHSRCETGC